MAMEKEILYKLGIIEGQTDGMKKDIKDIKDYYIAHDKRIRKLEIKAPIIGAIAVVVSTVLMVSLAIAKVFK